MQCLDQTTLLVADLGLQAERSAGVAREREALISAGLGEVQTSSKPNIDSAGDRIARHAAQRGFTLLHTTLSLCLMMGILWNLQTLLSWSVIQHHAFHQRTQAFLKARALMGVVMNASIAEEKCEIHIIDARAIQSRGAQVTPRGGSLALWLTSGDDCKKMRVIYVTTEDHVAIWEESGRAEVWFDDLALWSLEAVDLRIHFIFKFAGEAAEHHLWLQKKAEEEEDAS